MEKFEISVKTASGIRHFKIKDYMHHDCEMCKYEVYENDQFIGSFEPDHHRNLHVCKDGGVLKQDVLDKIAIELERYHI
ncbi:hypothetical protein [Mucilaginibacter auburnensis]|uniref:Uncharacterized protein n=1 Tax=Mucilaginibacter auburnensis TaxID=1457233 RepID=A0A2H9VL91_9SPHI|nr:hypothetical protein [Mucilaginibacter auburnensis]PJJ79108.1 hypothetical protein CLV57_2232 [Mucilaginibacter auburnensis]